MDVLNAGIVHTTATPGFWVQGAFKYSTENGGADRRPVEILAGLGEQNIFQFFGKGRDLDILVGKQTAVYIGECRQSRVIVRQILVPLLWLLIQHPEQFCQSLTNPGSRNILQVVMEHIPPPENPGILGVQAEHQPNAKGIQAFQRFRGGGVFVLLQQRIIQHTHQFTGLQGNFHFLFDGLTSGVHQKLQSGIILLQICQHQYFRLAVGEVHIVDLKGLEITDHDPARRLIKREVSGITAGLLVRRQHLTVRLLIALFQINVRAFLLNQNAGISQITVNKAGVA